MKHWKELFKPWILAQGQEYYECGQVVILEHSGDTISADVSGNSLYRVEIQKSGNRVVQMTCSCPYADGDENCKHMAAVLLALEEEPQNVPMDWQSALAQLPAADLRELLSSLALRDNALQNRIIRMVSGPGDDSRQWSNSLEQIVCSHADYHGWLDYKQAYDCMVDIADYLEECLPSLLAGRKVLDAAKLVMIVYETAFGLDIDDSDGGLSLVSETCRKGLEQVLSIADRQQETKIFYLLHASMEHSNWSYGSDDLEDLILSLSWSQELQQKNLEWLDDNLDSCRIHRRAVLMEKMGALQAEIIDWWEQHREYDSAYRPLLALYTDNNLPKAIELVREKRKLANNTPWQITDYTKTLLRLLEQAGEQAQYETELWYLVMELKCHETAYLSQLKRCIPQEKWNSLFAALLADAKSPGDRMRLYHFEEMYDTLFGELRRQPSLSSFLCYKDELRRWNPDRTLKMYTELLKREMDTSSDRKQYRRLIDHLSDLNAFPGGEKAAQMLAAYWHIYHKNRPAMKDELRKAGYPQG